MTARDALSPQWKPRLTGSLPADEFVKKYAPSMYAGDWQDVPNSHEFLAGGDHGWDLDELTASVATEGVRSPVQVDPHFGDVQEGHHRVIAALRAGAHIPFEGDWGTSASQ